MAINLAGGVTGSKNEVETGTLAQRSTLRPVDVITGAGGSYSISVKSGIMAAGLAGAAPILAFQFPGTGLALVRRIRFIAQGLGTGFAAGATVFDAFVARAFTVQDTGGGAATLTTNNAKLRTSFATTQAKIQLSATATLTAGTRTLDANPLRTLMGDLGTGTFAAVQGDDTLFDTKPGEWPLVLATNEGFVLQATVPATGTWTWAAMIDWDEIGALTF